MNESFESLAGQLVRVRFPLVSPEPSARALATQHPIAFVAAVAQESMAAKKKWDEHLPFRKAAFVPRDEEAFVASSREIHPLEFSRAIHRTSWAFWVETLELPVDPPPPMAEALVAPWKAVPLLWS